MAYVKRLRGRGVRGVIEVNAEVLFTPTTDVGAFERRLRERIAAAVVFHAPSNKRPHWAHYGKPLKSTIKRTVKYSPARLKIYGAVGSSAPYALYVDQGTGVHGGNGPYLARIIPPYKRGEGSLYESTWRPGGPGTRKVRPVFIKGQKGQEFFAKGIADGFRSVQLRSYQLPGEGVGKIGDVAAKAPDFGNFLGNTPSTGAFRAQLEDWRLWREAAFERGRLGRTNYPGRKPRSRADRQAEGLKKAKIKKNQGDFEESRAFSDLRKAEATQRARQAKALKAEKAAREAEEKAKELAAQDLRFGNQKTRRQAYNFYNKIRQAHPDAVIGQTALGDGVILYRVTYQSGGETVRQNFAYGYADS